MVAVDFQVTASSAPKRSARDRCSRTPSLGRYEVRVSGLLKGDRPGTGLLRRVHHRTIRSADDDERAGDDNYECDAGDTADDGLARRLPRPSRQSANSSR